MTVEEYYTKYLCDNGMFAVQAEEVLQKVKDNAEQNGTTDVQWSSPVEGYPPQLLAVLKMTIDAMAVEWIDDQLPKAWYRPIFAHDVVPPPA